MHSLYDREKHKDFMLQEVTGEKIEIKVLRQHFLQATNHEEDKAAGASVRIQEVHVMNRTCWLVVTLAEEEEGIKKSVPFLTCLGVQNYLHQHIICEL